MEPLANPIDGDEGWEPMAREKRDTHVTLPCLAEPNTSIELAHGDKAHT